MIKLAIYALLFLPLCGRSQANWTIYNTTNSPITTNKTQCITQSNSGNLWVGTNQGLWQFDGNNWFSYTTSNSDIPSNDIRSVFIDDTNNIWVGTFNDGLALFSNGIWRSWNVLNSNLPDNFVRDITINDSSVLFVATTFGFASFRHDSISYVWQMTNSNLWSNNITSLAFIDSTLYTGSINGGMNVLADTTLTVFNSSNSSFTDNTILDLDVFSGDIWCATPSSGLIRFVPPGGIQVFSTINTLIPSNSLTSVHSGSVLFAGSQDFGLISYENGTFYSYNMANSLMPDNHVTCIYETTDALWVGTNNAGLVQIENFNTINENVSSHTFYYSDNKLFFKPFEDGYVHIYDIYGRCVLKQDVNEEILDISSLLNGFFVAELYSKTGRQHLTFVKN